MLGQFNEISEEPRLSTQAFTLITVIITLLMVLRDVDLALRRDLISFPPHCFASLDFIYLGLG